MDQRKLNETSLAEFYHDGFVADQTRHFLEISSIKPESGVVVDVGGGCGYFAKSLSRNFGYQVRVLDMDENSVSACQKAGVLAELGDAAAPGFKGDEAAASFNLILHHIITDCEKDTRELQKKVLLVWRNRVAGIFVNEYIYESFLGNASGSLIYHITKSKILSFFAGLAAKIFPSLSANTLGVGVRFRAHAEWIDLFSEAGFKVVSKEYGVPEKVSMPLRILLIKQIRRDSFWLEKA